MNKQEINKTFFEDLHKSQMNTINNEMIKNNSKINDNIIEEAGAIMLKLIEAISDNDLENYDELETRALQWLKNNMK